MRERGLTKFLENPDRSLQGLHACLGILSIPPLLTPKSYCIAFQGEGIQVISGPGLTLSTSFFLYTENGNLDSNGHLEKINSFVSPYFLSWNAVMITTIYQTLASEW